MPLINFALKYPDVIEPFGTLPGQTMHWFGLTDGTYWLELGEVNLYEYAPSFLTTGDGSASTCADYYLIRFIEDFTDLFARISDCIPDDLYAIARNYATLRNFRDAATTWLDEVGDDDSDAANARFKQYNRLTEWIHRRELTAGYLVGGPSVAFFRSDDNLSIVWKADQTTEDNLPLWTAQTGQIEMTFAEFVEQVADFGNRFFLAMDEQVQTAVSRNWGSIQLDKTQLIEEQQERKTQFSQDLNRLKKKPVE